MSRSWVDIHLVANGGGSHTVTGERICENQLTKTTLFGKLMIESHGIDVRVVPQGMKVILFMTDSANKS